MFSVPEGRAANQPPREMTLTPPIGASLPGARVRICSIGSPARSRLWTCCPSSLASLAFCAGLAGASIRSAKEAPSSCMSARYCSPGACRDFGRQQRRHDAVLIGRPYPSVDTAERGAGAFLPAEAELPIHQTVGEPLEAHRDFVHGALQSLAHPIDHGAAHHRFADRGIRAPTAAMAE